MRRALIGYTGFVGSNLDRDMDGITHRYNSQNFRDMAGEQFDEVICAGVQAVKWWANQNPDEDWATIQPLLDVLDQVQTRQFTLISTVDVYKRPLDVDEDTPVEIDGLHPYGAHRWKVENWVRAKFDGARVVRLPGLFGPGLKKNLIFDLMHGRDVSGFDARSSFQFYDLARLAGDLKIVADNDLDCVNIATEPVSVAAVAERLTGQPYTRHTENGPMNYDMRSNHAGVWGKTGRYLVSADETLDAIATYAASGAA